MDARYPVMIIMILSVLLTCLVGCGSTPSENPADLSETVTASTEGNAALTEFTAETLDGSEFSPETLAAADLTVLNIWQTTCPPCIREMPELAELERELPDRVRFVTWCLDGAYAAEETRSILSEAGFGGTTIISGDGDLMEFLSTVQYTPTTVFIDREGNLIGEPVIGAAPQPKVMYTQKINEVLSSLGLQELAA